jgi:hypothetical protein
MMDIANCIVMLPTFAIKNGANIPRPWQLGKRRDPIIDRLWHASWPSGHASIAHLNAHLLGAIAGADAPQRARLDQIASLIASNRERALVHTPLDSAAGEELGSAVGRWLVESATTSCDSHRVWASLYELARRQLLT